MTENKGHLIYSSGLKLFKKYGPKKVSIDMIVNDAGVAKGTFYTYYENKIALYEQIIDNILEKGKQYMYLLVEKFPDPKQRLMCDFLNSLEFFSGKSSIIKNLMDENEDYFIGKINLIYLEDAHKEMISILFHDIIEDVFECDEDLLKFAYDLFGFYKYAQQFRCSYKSDEDFKNFMAKLAYFFIEGLFSDYFKKIGTIKYHDYAETLIGLKHCKNFLKDY